jgi:hypothetical protein
LALRRVGSELICLIADGEEVTLRELARVPFTTGTVRTFRIFADPGMSPTSVDAQVGNVRVRAEEITGGVPASEKSTGLGWWLAIAAIMAGGVLFVIWRKWRE